MMSSEQEETNNNITPDAAAGFANNNNNDDDDDDGGTTTTNFNSARGNDANNEAAPPADAVGLIALAPQEEEEEEEGENTAVAVAVAAAVTTGTANHETDSQQENNNESSSRATGDGTSVSIATPAAASLTLTTTAANKKKTKKKVGSKKGGRRVDRPQSYWYRLCLLFDRGDYKSQIQFLRSADSGDDVGEAHRMHFSRAYKKYQNGTLGNCEETRARKRKYEPLEQRVIQYWQEQQQQQLLEQQQQQQQEEEEEKEEEEEAAAAQQAAEQQLLYEPFNPTAATDQHQQDYGMAAVMGNATTTATTGTDNPINTNTTAAAPNTSRKRARTSNSTTTNNNSKSKKGKSPLAWSILQAKAKEWAQEMGLDDGFQASAGWIDNVLKRHQRESLAQQTRASLDATLAQRRSQAQLSQKMSYWQRRLHRSHQWTVIQNKSFQVGDRVTVLDVSQQVGDLVITRIAINTSVEEDSDPSVNNNNNNNNSNNVDDPTSEETTLMVERKRHGSTQRFALADARKAVKHLPQEEDTPTVQRLLLPQNQDPVLAHMAHFNSTGTSTSTNKSNRASSSRVLRPIWEFPQQQQQQQQQHDNDGNAVAANNKMTTPTSMRLEYSDTSCPEKINIQILKNTVLPMFRKDQKERQKLLEELQHRSSRTKAQQETLEKLQYAQMTHDMAKDLYAMVKNMPARGRVVVYQVDYEALDAAMRGRLMAHNPAPLEDDDDDYETHTDNVQECVKSYAPRTLTLQGMPSDLRTALVSSFAHLITTAADRDMQLRIFCSLAHICHATDLIPSWLDYQMHATDWCDYIQNIHVGISPAQAKLLPRMLMQGGTYETWKQAMDEQTAIRLPSSTDESWTNLQTWVMRLSTEWRALRDIVLALPQFAWTKIDRNAMLTNHDKAPAAIPNVLMVRVLQACERDIWTLVEHTFVNQGWKIRAKLMEGVLVEGPTTSVDPVSPVLAAAQHACHMRGWNLQLVEGHCFGAYHPGRNSNHKDALPSLQEARNAMEQMQQQQQQQQQQSNSSSIQHNNNNNNTDIITAGNITIDPANGGTVNVSVNANVNTNTDTAPPMDLDPTTGTGDMAIFGQMALT